MVYPSMEETDLIIVRNYDKFVSTIIKNGLPEFISFENDLELDRNDEIGPDGYAAAKCLVYESGINIKDLKFKVHSTNPKA